jgi:tetratricopeptide (TPR) repeat protein
MKVLNRRCKAQIQLLKFDEAIASFGYLYEIDQSLETKNELQLAEDLKSNYLNYFCHEKKQEYSDALKCINYLTTRIPKNQHLNLMKVESLAREGHTHSALTLLKITPMASTSSPDICYLRGIIGLYEGNNERAKEYFAKGLEVGCQKCREALLRT